LDHHEGCVPYDDLTVQVMSLQRQLVVDVTKNRKRPREAYDEMVASISDREEIVKKFPKYNSLKSALFRALAKGIVSVLNLSFSEFCASYTVFFLLVLEIDGKSRRCSPRSSSHQSR
jgi:hypothetical protein